MEPAQELRTSEPKPTEEVGVVDNIRLRQGTYRLHIFIEEARSLYPPEGKDTSDPVFMVSAFGTTKSTNDYSNVGSTSTIPINEHIYIEAADMSGDIINNERLTITVRDHGGLGFSHGIIGVHEIDMTYVYSNKDHCILHRWVVLSNPEDNNFELMRGYLKIGISLLHEDDKAVDLACRENPSEKDKDMIIPPHVKPIPVQLIIQVIKAESLPVMDKGKTIDAYCLARFAGSECKTSVYTADKATLTAYWYEELFIPVITPCVTSTLSLTFWDHDALSKDDLVGAIILNFDNIKKGKYNKYFWSNIYGAPPLSEGEQANFMNRVPACASHWRGRVLLKSWVDFPKETYKKCAKIADKEIHIKIRDEFETGQDFEMRSQIYSASALPFRKGKYSIRIEWSGVVAQSSIVETNNGSADWFETCKRQIALMPKDSELVMPDAFIYLILDEVKICFCRINAKELRDKEKAATWRQMVPDKSVGKVKDDWNAGFVKVRVYIGEFDPDNDDSSSFNWKKVTKPKFEDWKLYVHAFQCRSLPAADKNGLADPYLIVYCAGTEYSTKERPIECTLNPRWYETFVMDVSILSVKDSAPIVIYVYDYDEIGSDDVLGVVFIEMTEAVVGAEDAPRPKWRQLSLGRKGTEKGEILVSFSLVKAIEKVKEFHIVPEFEDKNVEINILGLRGLKPAVGWLPVNKAYVRFDLNSLSLPGENIGIKSIETQPFDSGSDPNIATTVSFKCKMPIDKIFCPILTATVNDYLFSGLTQPLIGSFSIDLAKYTTKYLAPVVLNSAIILKGLKKKPVADLKEIHEESEDADEDKRKPERKETELVNEIEEEKDESAPLAQDLEETKEEIIEENKKLNESVKPIEELTFEEVCGDKDNIVIKALFETKKKKIIEVRIPNPKFFMQISYNRVMGDDHKYYRYYINEPLENTFLFTDLPFEEIEVIRGQCRGAEDDLFSFGKQKDVTGEISTIETVGKFKAVIRMTEYPPIKSDDEFSLITRMLLCKVKCTVRVYIIDAFDLEQKDRLSQSDPYVKIKLARKVRSDRENYQEDISNPKIYKAFELSTTLPGKSMLKIQMWDYNSLTSDSKIGTSCIDLEDRYFNKKWLAVENKPIETRPLHLKSSRRPQGFVRLWVEIYPGKPISPLEDISLKPPGEFEARVIVWRACDVPNMDAEGVSDVFVAIKLNNLQEKETDTHYRAASNRASWNWRMKFNLTLPQDRNILTVQLWDKDILSGNDFISEASLDFDSLAKEAWENDIPVQMLGESDDLKDRMLGKQREIFWVQCKQRNVNGNIYNCGRVLLSFEILPKKRAENSQVGEGRNEPNVNPYLPAPVGRIKLSLNPFTMLFQLVGPGFKLKICLLLCALLICFAIFFTIPILLSDTVRSILF